jgi:biopolymer transport protein ExbB
METEQAGLVAETIALWLSGGWLMIPLVMIALFIYWTAFDALFYFSAHRFYKVPKNQLREWVENPDRAQGELKEILDYSIESSVKTVGDVRSRFEEIHTTYLSRIDRQRKFLFILIGVAPLMGLLGTVTGMLSTFQGLSTGSGSNTVDLIAGGISEALITTQTGLIIAIPAYVIAFLVMKRRNEMENCLIAVETLMVQAFEKKHKQVI